MIFLVITQFNFTILTGENERIRGKRGDSDLHKLKLLMIFLMVPWILRPPQVYTSNLLIFISKDCELCASNRRNTKIGIKGVASILCGFGVYVKGFLILSHLVPVKREIPALRES